MGLFTRHSEAYTFRRGPQAWLYTTDDRPLVLQGQTYLPVKGMKRSAIVQTQELDKASLDLTVPIGFPLLQQYLPAPPMEKVSVVVLRVTQAAPSPFVIWTGVVSDVEDTDSQATLHCVGGQAALTSNGLSRNWQKSCPLCVYSVGSGQCNASLAAMRVEGVVVAASGTVVSAAAFATKPDGWFDGGFVRWEEGLNVERRFVVSHCQTTLTLLTPTTLREGQALTAYPGCDQTLATCASKFANSDNYGGQPGIPRNNPFGGDPIF